jgi:VanZ family protein
LKIIPRVYHIGLLLYLIIIFILSSIPGDDFPKVDFEFSDKVVHIIIYAILFLLFFYSLKNQSKYVKLQKFALQYSLLFTCLYGVTDELHQYFVPNRSCELYDWFADVIGGLIMYAIIKFYSAKKKSVIVVLMMIVLYGCSSSGDTGSTNVTITKEEAWLNLMPSIGENNNNFGFSISIDIKAPSPGGNYIVKDLKIYLNNDTLENKKLSVENSEIKKGETQINISQQISEKYLDKDKPLPDEAQFVFSVYNGNTKLKNIKTSKLKINRVY